MTEIQNICAQNTAKVSMALLILRQIVPGEKCGIDLGEYGEIMHPLIEAEQKLKRSIRDATTGIKWTDLPPE